MRTITAIPFLFISLFALPLQSLGQAGPGRDSLEQDTLHTKIPIITLAETELEPEDGIENISSLLSANNDLFTNVAAFNFGVARFRMRGYDNNATQVFVNGSHMGDLETGRTFWSLWGGLNDVFRNRDINLGLAPTDFTFGGINGATNVDIGAASQRKQTRVSYASSNRSYFHRVMAVHSQELGDDLHLSLSGSRRWAQEGYVEGTFYDSWSYFMGLEKKFDGGHSLALNIFGSPTRRGRGSAATQELYDIAGTNYYNPNWGWQDGEKRNARVNDGHQPVTMLRHEWEIDEKSRLSTAVSYQFGRYGSSALEWNNAADPRPDYYRNMPSWIARDDEEWASIVEQNLLDNPDLLQIDWQALYNANWTAEPETVENANGIAGNTITGQRARYIIEDRRYDRQKFDFTTNYSNQFSSNVTFNGGLFYRRQRNHNHKRIKDLLGADYFLDLDRFAERDFPNNPDALQNNLDAPNRVVREGDIFGYSYDINVENAGGWGQLQVGLNRFDLFLSGNADYYGFWRAGNYRNGRFPDRSQGKSDRAEFLQYGIKAGGTYKIDGRNYLFANAARVERAPSVREAFLSPRTRHDMVEGMTTEKINTVEGGYHLKTQRFKVRVTGYFTEFQDGLETLNFYNDIERTFGAFVTNGVDRRHFGLELAASAELFTGFSLQGAAAIGQYTYTNRPEGLFVLDNTNEVRNFGKVYQENFYVPGTPQRAYSAGFRYSSPKFWFANVNLNFFEEMYLDFDPLTRTIDGSAYYEPGSAEWYESLEQVKLENQMTLDIFGGKSWMIQKRGGDRDFVYLTIGVSNLLNNQDFISGGYEQLRVGLVDFETDRFYYAYGINYFAQLAYRF